MGENGLAAFDITLRFFRGIVQRRYLLKHMVIRDLRNRYTGSLIGVFWSVIHPLIMVLTYTFVFSFVLKAKLGVEAGGINYTLWLLCGLMPWFLFSETLQRSSNILIENKMLITKSLFPSELLPVSVILSNMLNHVIVFTIIVAIVLASRGALHPAILLLPFYTFMLVIFSLGLSWLVSSVNIFFRDVGQIINVLIGFWFFYTPIFYDPHTLSPALRIALKLNPLYHMVEGYRLALLGIGEPSLGGAAYLCLASFGSFALGGMVFKRLKPEFAEIL
jgi:ABC-type polysaccharide/polyol phosphate export permease